MRRFPAVLATGMVFALSVIGAVNSEAQDNQVMGEVRFAGATKVERESGVWVDGLYVGYVKELKGSKKILLLPGDHEISVRQAGYKNFDQKEVVEPGSLRTITVKMEKDPTAQYPGAGAAILKLRITPDRAAVCRLLLCCRRWALTMRTAKGSRSSCSYFVT
jgi:hypothetical protein